MASPIVELKDLSLSIEEADLKAAMKSDLESYRGVGSLTEDDVYLYPCGMSAIFHAYMAVLRTLEMDGRPAGKSVCFGFVVFAVLTCRCLTHCFVSFPYTDTLKILEKWGPGCHHFGHGLDNDIDQLERLLKSQPADQPRITSLFCEFPSNPLLRSADLSRLRLLADRFGFVIVVDETIGTFVNVEILPLVDIVVSSLTKVFSGDSNVMGGRFVI